MRPEDAKARSGRTVWALVLMIGGLALLAIGVIAGLVTPLALLVSFVGGLLSFTGIATVSYTHLDVYKRQLQPSAGATCSAKACSTCRL